MPESHIVAAAEPGKEHLASLRRRAGLGAEAIAAGATKVISGACDPAFSILRALLPLHGGLWSGTSTAPGPGLSALLGSGSASRPGSGGG